MKFGTLHHIEPDLNVILNVTKNWNFWNSRRRRAPSWKSLFGHNSSTSSPISAKCCTRKQNGMSTRATWQKLPIFKMQDGRQPPLWKSLNRHISVKNRPILVKFGKLQQILNRWQSRDQKLKFSKFKMAAAAILKIDFLAITYRPIVRFQRNFVWGSRTACRQRLNDKICKFFKSKMADGRHFEIVKLP